MNYERMKEVQARAQVSDDVDELRRLLWEACGSSHGHRLDADSLRSRVNQLAGGADVEADNRRLISSLVQAERRAQRNFRDMTRAINRMAFWHGKWAVLKLENNALRRKTAEKRP